MALFASPDIAGIRRTAVQLGRVPVTEVADGAPYGDLVLLVGTSAAFVAFAGNP